MKRDALQYFSYLEDRMKTPTKVEGDVPPEADKSCRTWFDFLPLRSHPDSNLRMGYYNECAPSKDHISTTY